MKKQNIVFITLFFFYNKKSKYVTIFLIIFLFLRFTFFLFLCYVAKLIFFLFFKKIIVQLTKTTNK